MDGSTGKVRRGRRIRRLALGAVLLLVAATVGSTTVLSAPDVRAETEIHLTAAGDYGARAATDTVLQKVAQLDADAHLALGDLSYRDVVPETAWCAYVKARIGEGFPFELISGNHDSLDVGDGMINNFSSCLPNQIPGVVGTYGREYYMDFPAGAPIVRVIQTAPTLTFEDGKWNYAVGDAHYNWLSNAIDDGRAKGAKWIIVTSHVPCLSVGEYNCPTTDFTNLLACEEGRSRAARSRARVHADGPTALGHHRLPDDPVGDVQRGVRRRQRQRVSVAGRAPCSRPLVRAARRCETSIPPTPRPRTSPRSRASTSIRRTGCST